MRRSPKSRSASAAGKSFADAAKEAASPRPSEFSKVTRAIAPDTASEPRNLFDAVRNVDPGGLADVITEADRAFIVHVATREVEKAAGRRGAGWMPKSPAAPARTR